MPRLADYLAVEAERPFIRKAHDDALDDADRLAYARLVEPTDPERAEWLRLEVALHARATDEPAVLARFIELARRIGLDYADLLLRETIMNCGREDLRRGPPRVRFAFACGKRWQTLASTAEPAVRRCQQCDERVYHCDTLADAEARAHAGHCIAIPRRLADGGGSDELVLGRPDPVRDWADRLFTLGPGARDSDRLLVLYARDPELVGRHFVLAEAEPTTLGRGADNTVVLADDGLSRRHARLERRADGWWLVDVGSTNGTFVNDVQVHEQRLLDGDRVTLGGCVLRLVARRRAAPPA
ncbi:MAG: FHA domain-containing protein [Myxococcales bacterium]|nr:FHA domain-containing protein [Myxococcales bacterium]